MSNTSAAAAPPRRAEGSGCARCFTAVVVVGPYVGDAHAPSPTCGWRAHHDPRSPSMHASAPGLDVRSRSRPRTGLKKPRSRPRHAPSGLLPRAPSIQCPRPIPTQPRRGVRRAAHGVDISPEPTTPGASLAPSADVSVSERRGRGRRRASKVIMDRAHPDVGIEGDRGSWCARHPYVSSCVFAPPTCRIVCGRRPHMGVGRNRTTPGAEGRSIGHRPLALTQSRRSLHVERARFLFWREAR